MLAPAGFQGRAAAVEFGILRCRYPAAENRPTVVRARTSRLLTHFVQEITRAPPKRTRLLRQSTPYRDLSSERRGAPMPRAEEAGGAQTYADSWNLPCFAIRRCVRVPLHAAKIPPRPRADGRAQ